jgi:putative ABC transport system permease protein
MPWLRRLLNALRPGRVERDIAREVAFHIAERADELRAAGLSDREAVRRARVQFGNPALQAERTRDADVAAGLDAFLRHLRYGVRTLSRTPGFTATVVLTLALGIGANTVVFSALDAVLLRPLPFPDADRLVELQQRRDNVAETLIAPVRLADWDRLNSTFQAITGYYMEDGSETSGDFPERIRRAWVAPRFLEVWGIAPARGRGFTSDEHRFGGPTAVLISHRYWTRRLSGAPDVLERTVRIGTAAMPIVGVMPASFRFPDRDVDLWFPVPIDAPYAQSRENTWYRGIGRLQPGVTPAQARENLAGVQAQLGEAHPETDRDLSVAVVPLKASAVGGVRGSLWLLFGAVSVLLLIACTNVAALLLSRSAQRQHELAVRLSLGASRRTIAAQLLTETALLALLGGVLGLAVARAALSALQAAAADLPRIDEAAIDGRILVYTLASIGAVTLLCGLLPALRATRGIPAAAGDMGRTQTAAHHGLQWGLVGAQVALSVTLLAAAGLLVRSFHELSQVEPGFDASHILTFRISGSWGETADYARLIQRIDGTIDELHTLPGVEHAATTGWALPGVPEQWEATFELAEARTEAERAMIAEGRAVSPEYFATLRIPLLAGEPCRRWAGDAAGDSSVGRDVMVNQAFVDRYLWERTSAVGLHLRQVDGPTPPGRIAGVVGNARERGVDRAPGPTVYWCFSAPNPTPYFLLRTSGDPVALAGAVRLKMKELEPLRSVYELAPLEHRIGAAFHENRLRARVLALFAVTALALACVGVYGTVSYVVSLRRREVGVRLALGATRGSIVRRFVWQGLRVAALACLGGLLPALMFGRVLSGMLYGVSPTDPVTLAGVAGLVLVVTALAALLPSTRAALVEPVQVLRQQ